MFKTSLSAPNPELRTPNPEILKLKVGTLVIKLLEDFRRAVLLIPPLAPPFIRGRDG